MLRGYLIEKYNDMGVAYTSDRLIQEAWKADILLDRIGVHDTLLTPGAVVNSGVVLDNRDVILNRYKWGWIKDTINGMGIRQYNRIAPFNIYVDKYAQLQRIHSALFQKPAFLLGTVQSDYGAVAAIVGQVFVAKGLRNSKGREIFLIRSQEDFKALQKVFLPETELLFEEFIENSFGRDLRLFCIRGEALGAMIRTSNGDFRSNFALGASVRAVAVNAELRQIAEDLYSQTELDFIGVDLLFGRDGYYLCEINVTPGIEGMESSTGVNVAAAMISLILNDFRS